MRERIGSIMRIITSLGTSLVIPDIEQYENKSAMLKDGVVCALIGAGIPLERTALYEEGVKKGNVVMRVRLRNNEDAEQFQRSWIVNSGIQIHL